MIKFEFYIVLHTTTIYCSSYIKRTYAYVPGSYTIHHILLFAFYSTLALHLDI